MRITGMLMKFLYATLRSLLLVAALARLAVAANTPSGTVISSTATVQYEISGVSQAPAAASTAFPVDNKVNVLVTRNADATVVPGTANQALSFLVTNLGNTTQRYALSIVSRMTDSFDMNNARIYRDNGTTPGVWDAGDTLYADAGTFGDVVSGGSLTILIVADTPAGQTNGQTAVYDLMATTVNAGSTTATTQTAGPDSGGVDVLFADAGGSASGDGARDGRHSSFGTFTIADVALIINKTVAVQDQYGGARPIPGAILHYAITVSVGGTGAANGIVISDPVPANTTYIPATLHLNGVPLTDAADTDAGEMGGTVPNTLTVRLGNLTPASPLQTILFDVRIN